MKITSFIKEADVIHKILAHLGLWEDKIPVERAPPVCNPERISETYDDGWPQYEKQSASLY